MWARVYMHRHREGLRWLSVVLLAALMAMTLATVANGIAPPKPHDVETVVVIVSPAYGVYRAAEYPGAKPYVAVGSKVEPDTLVGIIETAYARESFDWLHVRAGVSGTVTEVLAKDGHVVTFGQALLKVVCRTPATSG